ncbi:MAG: hypothetical protein WBE26_05515 [Phycisphaerae bacterium]
MIPVKRQPEPSDFNRLVRDPGKNHLRASPTPTPEPKYVRKKRLWEKVAGHLHAAYSEICAYSCHRIALVTGFRTVEHFIPIRVDPQKAYEWDNYRLVCGRLNGLKGAHQDVLDPFELDDNVFALDFPSLLVKPGSGLRSQLEADVRATIKRLKLNDNETCIHERERRVRDYCTGEISFNHLRKEAPFIAHELERQGLVRKIMNIMGYSQSAQATRGDADATDT